MIKGTSAGTTLRGMFSRLAKPTEKAQEIMNDLGITVYDNEGKFRSISDIIGIVGEKTAGLSEEERNFALSTIFGQQALTGVLALMEAGPDKINELTASYQGCDGAAKEMADTINDNTKGAWIEFKSALEGAAIAIGEVLLPHIKKGIEWLTDMVTAFGNLDPAVQENIVKWGAIAAAIGPVLIIGGKFVGMIGTMVSALSGLGGVFATLAGPAGWIVLAGTALAGLIISWCNFQKNLTENTGGFLEANKNFEEFDGRIRTTDSLIGRVFGKEIKIEFSAEFEQLDTDIKNHYDFMLADAEEFYRKKWEIDHDGCEDVNEHYKHMEEFERQYQERKKHRQEVLAQDNINEGNSSVTNMQEYLQNEMGFSKEEAEQATTEYKQWMDEKVEIVNNAEQEIEEIYEHGVGVTGELTKEQQERITELTEQGADARQVIWATTEDQYNVFKSQHYAEGVMYNEKGERVSKYQKDFVKSMNEGKEALLNSYDEQIKKTREAGEIFGADTKEAVAQWEAKRSALLHFSEEFKNRTSNNIRDGQEFAEANSNAFESIIKDLESGKINVEEFGLTTDDYLQVAIEAMLAGGANADELAFAIEKIPKEKRAQVLSNIQGEEEAKRLKEALDRLRDKQIKVITQYENWYTDKKTGKKYGYQNGVAGYYATGTEHALSGVATVAEYGPEIIANNNTAMLATGRQMVNLSGGEKIYNARQTKDILDNMGKSSQIDYSDSLRIINSNIILLKEAIERKNFSNVVNNNIEKIDINEVANIEEIEYQLTEMMERRTYGGV